MPGCTVPYLRRDFSDCLIFEKRLLASRFNEIDFFPILLVGLPPSGVPSDAGKMGNLKKSRFASSLGIKSLPSNSWTCFLRFESFLFAALFFKMAFWKDTGCIATS